MRSSEAAPASYAALREPDVYPQESVEEGRDAAGRGRTRRDAEGRERDLGTGLCLLPSPFQAVKDLAGVLDGDGVAIRAGHHCAQPLHRPAFSMLHAFLRVFSIMQRRLSFLALPLASSPQGSGSHLRIRQGELRLLQHEGRD